MCLVSKEVVDVKTVFSISDGAGGSGWFFQSDQAHGKVCKYTLCEGDD